MRGPGLIIVTGCTSGMGPVISQEFLLRGNSVLITGRGGEPGMKVLDEVLMDVTKEVKKRREEFEDKTGFSPDGRIPERLDGMTMQVDISNSKDIDSLATFVKENNFDRVTLINNAAVGGKTWNPETLKNCMETNVWGTINLSQKMIKVMPKTSRIYHVLCREARPRPRSGVRIPNELLDELYHVSTPKELSKLLHKRTQYFEHPELLKTPHAPYLYSKICQYAYAKMSAKTETDIYINGICPGPMGTKLCMYDDCYRDPFEATAVFNQSINWDDLEGNRACRAYWRYHQKYPIGYLFSTEGLMPMADHCNPEAPSNRKVHSEKRIFVENPEQNWRHQNAPSGIDKFTNYVKSFLSKS